jgi:hypothetical protein
MVRVGALDVLLPDFAVGDSVTSDGKGKSTLVVVLGPIVLTVWYAEGRLEHTEQFVNTLLKKLGPKDHERKPTILGGTRFERLAMRDAAETYAEYNAAFTDLFGDFVCVAWGYKEVPQPPDKEAIEMLVNSMVQGIVVRRQANVPPDAIAAWMKRQDAMAAAASAKPATVRTKKPWWKLW